MTSESNLQEPLLPLEQGSTYSTELNAGDAQPVTRPEAQQGWASGGFGWVAPLLKRGSRQGQLQPEDLFELPPDLLPEATGRALWRFWKKVRLERRGAGSSLQCRAGAGSRARNGLASFCPPD